MKKTLSKVVVILLLTCMLTPASTIQLTESSNPEPAFLADLHVEESSSTPRLSSTTGVLQDYDGSYQRWRDIAENNYTESYQGSFDYSQAYVRVTYEELSSTFKGTFDATGLKPNFAYQLKLMGKPDEDPVADQHLREIGRTYDIALGVEVGFVIFDYVVTDRNGAVHKQFSLADSYHVLWKVSQRTPQGKDSTPSNHVVEGDPADPPHAYEASVGPATVQVYAEWEKGEPGQVRPPYGTYDVKFIITEESFHSPIGDSDGGYWSTVMGCDVYFTVARQHLLEVETEPADITAISGGGWYLEGTDAALTAPEYVSASTDVRYRFDYWDVDGTPQSGRLITVTMDNNHTATAHYVLQNYLAVNSPHGSPTPASGWFDDGTTIVSSVASPSPGPTGTRYICNGWTGTGSVPTSGTATAVTFALENPSSITWSWKTQHLLTVLTNPPELSPQPTRNPTGTAGPTNAWWYYRFAEVTLTAQSVAGHRFNNWDVDGTPQDTGANPLTITVDGSHTATAHYEPSGPEHDIAITNVTPSRPIIDTTHTMYINVTAENRGTHTESFNVTLYANTTVIETRELNNLPDRTSAVLSFTWNTTGIHLGNYTLKGEASIIPGEENTADNTFADAWIVITLLGDLDGNMAVDILDVVIIAIAFDSRPGDPDWNPNADVAETYGEIDIYDVVRVTLNFGKTA